MQPKPSISPVNNVSAMTHMNVVGDTAEELGFRFEQLNLAQLSKGQLYQGRVLARLDDQSFLVSLNGGAIKMGLAQSTQIGEMVSLRYMGGFPTPTFLLAPQLQSVSYTRISDAAQLINQFLSAAENKGAPARFEASQPVTASPYNTPQQIAADLRQALAMTGLFYESHLAAFVFGKRPLSAILQEPHNQPASTLHALVPQQLQILEQQRLLWHGEVWPRQTMEWEIQRKSAQEESTHEESSADEETIDSRISLHLPRLGDVTAHISIVNGHMQIAMRAGKESTVQVLKQESAKLVDSLKAAGQTLDQLTVQNALNGKAHEPDSTP